MSMTSVLDPVTKHVEKVVHIPSEDLSVGLGSAVAVNIVEAVEENVARGWWKVLLYLLGSGGTLVLGGMNEDSRVKKEAAIIGSFFAVDVVKTLALEWDEVVKSTVELADAVKRGDAFAALTSMVKPEIVSGIKFAPSKPKVEVIEVPTKPSGAGGAGGVSGGKRKAIC